MSPSNPYTTPALRVANGMAMLAAAPKGFTPKLTATLKVAQAWLSVIGVSGEHYRVMSSTDHKKWQPVPTPDDPQQQLRFSDPTATTDKKRVYRLELAAAGK